MSLESILARLPEGAISLLWVSGALILGIAVAVVLPWLLRRVSGVLPEGPGSLVLRKLAAPIRLLVPVAAVEIASGLVSLPEPAAGFLGGALRVLFIVDIAWFLLRLLSAGEQLMLRGYRTDVADNLQARRVHTQIRVIRRVLAAAVDLLALSAILMGFEPVRQIGTTLLASAGVAGIIVGLAAQRTLGSLVAGLQVAFAQPIRLGDAVVVQGEWGWIEEITLTFVVVRIWDRRRLVVPVTFFTESSFQNWTRSSADLIGSVYLYADYTLPVAELRQKLRSLLEENPKWDGEVCVLQVVGAGEKTIELRALVSAQDSPTLWNLRCEVREALIAHMQERYPEQLPRFRATLDGEPARITSK